jgi:hypothetical protein
VRVSVYVGTSVCRAVHYNDKWHILLTEVNWNRLFIGSETSRRRFSAIGIAADGRV